MSYIFMSRFWEFLWSFMNWPYKLDHHATIWTVINSHKCFHNPPIEFDVKKCSRIARLQSLWLLWPHSKISFDLWMKRCSVGNGVRTFFMTKFITSLYFGTEYYLPFHLCWLCALTPVSFKLLLCFQGPNSCSY